MPAEVGISVQPSGAFRRSQLSRDPASLPLCSLHSSWPGLKGWGWAGNAACDTVAQSLPCPSAGTALLPSRPIILPPKCVRTPLPQGCPPLPATPGLDPLVLSAGTFLRCAWACSLGQSPGEGATHGAAAIVTQGHPAGGWWGPILHPEPVAPPAPWPASLHPGHGDEDARACLLKAKETSLLCTQSVISVNYA